MRSGLRPLINSFSVFRLIFLILFLLGNINLVVADDPGITKARLIQQSDSLFLLEADVPLNVLNAIQKPLFPERFTMADFSYEEQSGWMTLQWTFRNSGGPLLPNEEIVLPWLRNGVDFTVQWLDGTTFKGLFNRSLNGIHIPMQEVMVVTKTTLEVLTQGFWMGLDHLTFKWIHVLLVLALVWSFPTRKALQLLLWYAFGQALAMVFIEFTVPTLDLLFSDILILCAVFVVAYGHIRQREGSNEGTILLVCGLLHGLSVASETLGMELGMLQHIQLLFAFNLAIDLGHLGLGVLLAMIAPGLKARMMKPQRVTVLFGATSVFLFMLVFVEHLATGQRKILTDGEATASIQIPVAPSSSSGQVQRGTGMMTTPIMAFVSVEPFEIRQEVLVKAGVALKLLNKEGSSSIIPVGEQEQLKGELSELIAANSELRIGNDSLEPVEVNANFVRLSRGGVSIRETPVDESTNEGIVGITYVYDVPSFPDSLSFKWELYPDTVSVVEASVVDPHGSFTELLHKKGPSLSWVSRLAGFQLPAVEPIFREKYPFPFVSVILWLGLIGLLAYALVKRRVIRINTWMMTIMALGFLLYPFVRTPTGLGFIPQWKPSNERTSMVLNDLLSNVYRAFDRRQEDAVYDRLALSVTGDQLTDIYLKNRQAMALQNRGGARAKVDEVNILEVFEVTHSEDEGFMADVAWTVRGSVNHFGHTHYRQNQYRALVSFIDDDEIWKISDIVTIDEKRVY